MRYSIEPLSRDNADQWEEFNAQSPEGTLFHSLRWKRVLEDVLHLRPRYYLILDGPDVVGISPGIEKSVMNFRGLVSNPHSETNNIVLDEDFNTDHFNKVLSLFARKYSFLNFSTYNSALSDKVRFAHVSQGDTGHMMLDLRQTSPDTLWTGLSKRTRYSIRAFENDGFEVQVIDQPGDLGEPYQHYVKNMMHIQGEILPFTFFATLLDRFSREELRITVLTRDDAFAGGSLAFVDPLSKTIYSDYLAINRDLPNRYTPTNYIAWESINWAWSNGHKQVHFGQQRLDPENPRFRNKTKFGAEHVPIHSVRVLFSKPVLVFYRIKKMLPESRNT
jgi:hypothetical protein